MARDGQRTDTPIAPVKTGLRILLFVSLALNLLVVGVVGGAVASRGWGVGPPPRPDRISGPLTQALSRADRRAIGLALRREYRKTHDTRVSIQQEFAPVIAALQSQPFDLQEVTQSLSLQHESQSSRQRLGQALLLQRLGEMDTSERAEFTERLIQALKHAADRDHRPPAN